MKLSAEFILAVREDHSLYALFMVGWSESNPRVGNGKAEGSFVLIEGCLPDQVTTEFHVGTAPNSSWEKTRIIKQHWDTQICRWKKVGLKKEMRREWHEIFGQIESSEKITEKENDMMQ